MEPKRKKRELTTHPQPTITNNTNQIFKYKDKREPREKE